MNPKEQIDHFLKELGLKLGIEDIGLNPEGVCAFTYLNSFDLIIEVSEESNTFVIHTPLTTLKSGNNEPLLKKLLSLNFLGIETQGASFALNKDTQEVVLCYNHPIENLQSNTFENLIGNFLEVAEKFWVQLSQYGDSLEEPQVPPGPAS